MSPADDARSDEELVGAANGGERGALEALYLRHRDWIFTVARRFCQNDADAADVLQETFLYFLDKFPGFELRAQLRTFLYPVAKHLAMNRRRQDERTEPLPEDLDRRPAATPRDEATERQALAEMVEKLPEIHREVIQLRFADGLDLEEMARALEIPPGTVKSRLHHALAALRGALG
jgi:RNA polymerase sigma-70 factor, ECF subfamily